MAESPSSDGSFRNREEDWPDPDVDLDTEEGEEILRRNEASLFASMDREARNRRRAVDEAYGNIPMSLYDKAVDHQDQLTEAERQRFLDRGDAIGKALANPDSLTADEFHDALGWPPPEVVRASIQRATSGRLSTPAELYAEAQDALDRGQFDVISDDAAFLIAHDFYTKDNYSPSKCMAAHGIPGYGSVLTLLLRRLRPDIAVWKACVSRSFPAPKPRPAAPKAQPNQEQYARELLDAAASIQEQYRLGTLSNQDYHARINDILPTYWGELNRLHPSLEPFTLPPGGPILHSSLPPGVPRPSQIDRAISGPWPFAYGSVGAFGVFQRDNGFPESPDGDFSYSPGGLSVSANGAVLIWATLSEDEKEPYRARAEVQRREAWAEYEASLARSDAGIPEPPVTDPGPPPPADYVEKMKELGYMLVYNPIPVLPVAGFEVFRDELVAGEGALGFAEVLARWEALTDDQRMPYGVRASTARRVAPAE